MRRLPTRLLRYAQGIAGLRPEDVLLASFPRSGSTWVRFFLCNLISLREMGGRTVGFPLLDATMVEIGVDDLRRPWSFSTLPRVVKTHRPYTTLLSRAGRRILVVRDPRDAVLSRYWYERGKQKRRFEGSLGDFIRHPKLGLPGWFHHYRSWARRADLTIAYERLAQAPGAEFRTLLDFLGVELDEALIDEAVARARFRNVQKVEDAGGHTDSEKFSRNFRFARHGGSGGWRANLSESDRSYYASLHRRMKIDVYPP